MNPYRCWLCKRVFTRRYFQKFCGHACSHNYRSESRQATFSCLSCKKLVTLPKSRTKGRQFCSPACSSVGRVGKTHPIRQVFVNKNCIGCGTLFRTPQSVDKKYCTHKCCLSSGKERFRQLGLSNKKYTPETLKLRSLESGRKSYRKHISTRLFYYRQLASKRHGIAGDFSQEEWAQKIREQGGRCAMCSEIMVKPTIDHKIPISRWDEWIKTHPLPYQCNDIQNIQALCKSCNSRKHNRLISPIIIEAAPNCTETIT